MNIIAEFWAFLVSRKKLWLLPIILITALFGAVLVLAEGSAVAPFIYSLF